MITMETYSNVNPTGKGTALDLELFGLPRTLIPLEKYSNVHNSENYKDNVHEMLVNINRVMEELEPIGLEPFTLSPQALLEVLIETFIDAGITSPLLPNEFVEMNATLLMERVWGFTDSFIAHPSILWGESMENITLGGTEYTSPCRNDGEQFQLAIIVILLGQIVLGRRERSHRKPVSKKATKNAQRQADKDSKRKAEKANRKKK